MPSAVRIDKWLWSVRLYKTRSLAADACKCGRVKFRDLAVKASREVQIGDVYHINHEQIHRVIEVKNLLQNRIPAKNVENYLVDLTPESEYERIRLIRQDSFERRENGSGRPTKKERREITDFKSNFPAEH